MEHAFPRGHLADVAAVSGAAGLRLAVSHGPAQKAVGSEAGQGATAGRVPGLVGAVERMASVVAMIGAVAGVEATQRFCFETGQRRAVVRAHRGSAGAGSRDTERRLRWAGLGTWRRPALGRCAFARLRASERR